MRKLLVRLLGRFSASIDGSSLELHRVQAQLLAYLAIAQGRAVSRGRLGGALWPDLPDERARANLSNAMWRLRRTIAQHGISERVVHSSIDAVWISPEQINLDLTLFADGAATVGGGLSLDALGRAVKALQQYRGDLLEDWDVEWCRLERENLRRRYVETLCAVGDAFETRGRVDLALRYFQQAVEADPYNERLFRRVMRLHLLLGDRTAAVSEFRRFTQLLQSELGLDPDAQTLRLLDELRHAGQFPTERAGEGFPEQVRLVGREEERQALASLVENGLRGAGGGAIIVGEAGIGKSRLAEWTAEAWAAGGGSVVQGRCVEFNEPVPYQPLLSALGQYVSHEDFIREVADDDSELTGIAVSGPSLSSDLRALDRALPLGKLRVFNWLRIKIEEVAARRPFLVVLEDLQWADPSTVDFVCYMLEYSRTSAVTLLVTGRPSPAEVGRGVRLDLVRRHCSVNLLLRPLSRRETYELAVSLLGSSRPRKGFHDWLYHETEGNPLFVVETLRLVHQRFGSLAGVECQGRAPWATGSEDGPVIPDGVRTAIQQRLSQLDSSAVCLAGAASVLGRSFDLEALRFISKMSENRLSGALATLARTGVFECESGGYRFAHDKIRAVCYEALTPTTRRSYHARCAAMLIQDLDVSAQTLAWHQQSAGLWTLATSSWVHAGDQALEMRALEEAARAYANAIRCLRRDHARLRHDRCVEQVSTLVRLDDVLALMGRLAERRQVVSQMGELIRRANLASCESIWLVRKAMLDEYSGNFTRAAKLARMALRRSSDAGQRAAEVSALRVLALALSRGGRERQSLRISRLALRKLGEGPSLQRAVILLEAAVVHQKLGEYPHALDCAQGARLVLATLGRGSESPFACLIEAAVQKQQGDLRSARTRIEAALGTLHGLGDVVTEARVTYQLATFDALEGRMPDSLRRLRSARSALRSAGYSRIYAACLNEIAYGVGRLLGNYEWAWQASEQALELSRAYQSAHATAIYLDTQAQLLLELDRVDEAQKVIDEAISMLGSDLTSTGQFSESLARRGTVFLRAGNLPRAVEDLEAARRAQTHRGEKLHLPDTLTHLAMAYALLGDADRAVAASEEALRVLAAVRGVNHQPQRIFWNHYMILARFDRQPRLPFLRRAVRSVEAQAATLTRAQARRFRVAVRVNRDILQAWAELHGRAPAPHDHPEGRDAPRPLTRPRPDAVERAPSVGAPSLRAP